MSHASSAAASTSPPTTTETTTETTLSSARVASLSEDVKQAIANLTLTTRAQSIYEANSQQQQPQTSSRTTPSHMSGSLPPLSTPALPTVVYSPEEKSASMTCVAKLQMREPAGSVSSTTAAPPPLVIPMGTPMVVDTGSPSPVTRSASGSFASTPATMPGVSRAGVGPSNGSGSYPATTTLPTSATNSGSQPSPTFENVNSNQSDTSKGPTTPQSKAIDERLSAAVSTGYRTAARKRVALAPGHSMMDWYRHCQRKEAPTNLRTFTLDEVAQHNKPDDLWMILHGRVYDITEYVPYHPGGLSELMRAAGKDGTALFIEAHHFVNFDAMLEKHLLGVVSRTTPRSGETSLK